MNCYQNWRPVKLLFRIFNINQVPAVVKVEDKQGNSFRSIYGDVTLEYALQKIEMC